MPDCNWLYSAWQVCTQEYNQMIEDHDDEEAAKSLECTDLFNAWYSQCMMGLTAGMTPAELPPMPTQCAGCDVEALKRRWDAMTEGERLCWCERVLRKAELCARLADQIAPLTGGSNAPPAASP